MTAKAATAIARDMQLWVRESEELARQELIKAAEAEVQRVLDEGRRLGGVEPTFVAIVDGREGAPLSSVKRSVSFVYDYKREVVKRALELIRARAPSGGDKGAKGPNSLRLGYKQHLYVFVNGEQVTDLRQIPFGARVMVVAAADYARRLEVGKKRDGSPFSSTGPNIVEWVAKRRLARFYSKLVSINFGYTDLDSPYILQGRLAGTKYKNKQGTTTTRQAWKDRKAGQPVRYPVIFLGDK